MIFKIHYGLWFGGLVGIMPFMFAYAKQYAGATALQHGVLYTILPFIALFAKPIVCSMADKYQSHRFVLILFVILTMIGYGSLAIYPQIPGFIDNNRQLVWLLYCLAALVGNTSACVVNSIGDALALNSCAKQNRSFGEYRLWGPVGFGLLGLVWGLAEDKIPLPQYTAGIFTLIIVHAFDALLLAFWIDKEEFIFNQAVCQQSSINSNDAKSSSKKVDSEYSNETLAILQPSQPQAHVSKFAYIRKVCLRHKSILGYFLLFTLCGILTAIHWQFFIRYLYEQAEAKKQDPILITTFSIPVQSLGGELVFFFLSGKILTAIGPAFSLAICLLSFAARYLAYAYLIPAVSIYWLLIVELLQGPTFGLMYCVLAYQAKHYSDCVEEMLAEENNELNNNRQSNQINFRRSLDATLQGILGASFEGLGLGLGAVFGGLSFDKSPLLMWKIGGYSALTCGILLFAINMTVRNGHRIRRS